MNLKQQSKLSILITLKRLLQLVCKNINEWVGWLYRRVEEWTNYKMNTKSITGRIPKGKRQPIFSRGSRVCQHATSPLCRRTLGGSMVKRCCTNIVHTIGHHKNLPTSEVTQWHEQFTRVTFWLFVGEGTTPLTSNRSEPETITNPAQWSSNHRAI